MVVAKTIPASSLRPPAFFSGVICWFVLGREKTVENERPEPNDNGGGDGSDDEFSLEQVGDSAKVPVHPRHPNKFKVRYD